MKYEKMKDYFLDLSTPEQAMEIATEDTLLVIVDTHKPSMVIEERLLYKIDHVVVIDHHRRGEEFINHPLLSLYGAICFIYCRTCNGTS